MATKDGTLGAPDPSPEPKRKIISNSLLTMKFMQKGQDDELSSKLLQKQLKEVSDQQWRLSVTNNNATRRPSSVRGISYEPSYSAFESQATAKGETGEKVLNRGRKTYGPFVPDVDELLESARTSSPKGPKGDESSRSNTHSTDSPLKRTKVSKDSNPVKKARRTESGKI